MKTLKLACDEGEPGYLNWTVSADTPDTVYYQVNNKLQEFYHYYSLNCLTN
jgi:hypothetical protein